MACEHQRKSVPPELILKLIHSVKILGRQKNRKSKIETDLVSTLVVGECCFQQGEKKLFWDKTKTRVFRSEKNFVQIGKTVEENEYVDRRTDGNEGVKMRLTFLFMQESIKRRIWNFCKKLPGIIVLGLWSHPNINHSTWQALRSWLTGKIQCLLVAVGKILTYCLGSRILPQIISLLYP